MSEENERSKLVSLRISQDMDETLDRLAMQRNQTKSEVMRDMITVGMRTVGAKLSDDRLYDIVKEAVEEVTRPSVERLAAISAKATQLDAAAFFMYLYTLTRDGSPEEQAKIQEAVESARRLGIQYLKLKDKDIDRFLRDGAGQIIDEN